MTMLAISAPMITTKSQNGTEPKAAMYRMVAGTAHTAAAIAAVVKLRRIVARFTSGFSLCNTWIAVVERVHACSNRIPVRAMGSRRRRPLAGPSESECHTPDTSRVRSPSLFESVSPSIPARAMEYSGNGGAGYSGHAPK